MTWLLCDYGEVLSLAPSPADRDALEVAAGVTGDAFWSEYWAHRPEYDRGTVTTDEYWSRVLGTRIPPTTIERLLECDATMWSRPNEASLAAVHRLAHDGHRLAILSNAPAPLADGLERLAWLAPFETRIFSGRLGLLKPESAIYHVTLAALGADPGDVIFVDDRAENIDAARALGLEAHVFTGPTTLEALARPT